MNQEDLVPFQAVKGALQGVAHICMVLLGVGCLGGHPQNIFNKCFLLLLSSLGKTAVFL